MKLFKLKKRWLLGGGLLVVVVILVIAVFAKSDEKVTTVQADLAYVDDISEVVTASGKISPQTKVDIVAEVSAQIINISVREGERVVRGQDLILLDTIQLKSDVQQARFSMDELTARTEAARAQAERDRLEYERQERLFNQKLTSEVTFTDSKYAYENSRANYEAMQAQVQTGQARLEKAEDNLTKTRIRAPMDGIVTFLNTEVGEIAQAQTSFTSGKTLMTVSDLSVFEVEIDVDETQIAKLKLDQPAKIRVDAFRDTSFAGVVTEIGNSALMTGQGTENMSTSFRVKIRFTDTDVAVRPGMSATVDVTTGLAEDATLLPYAAVVTREINADSLAAKDQTTGESSGLANNAQASVGVAVAAGTDSTNQAVNKSRKKKEMIRQSGVYVIRDGKAKFIELETGIADARNIVAMSGLAPGDTVISGSFQTLRKLHDGDVVKIEESSLQRMKENEG